MTKCEGCGARLGADELCSRSGVKGYACPPFVVTDYVTILAHAYSPTQARRRAAALLASLAHTDSVSDARRGAAYKLMGRSA